MVIKYHSALLLDSLNFVNILIQTKLFVYFSSFDDLFLVLVYSNIKVALLLY